MPSLLPGLEYDIFISYRHNDNLDGWVTDFVQNLEKELRSTLKDTVTIYFDRNPHDGLLETHSVDKTLEGKLKCLIFLPIISQTYCDTKSFAWQHEFVSFNKLAKEDQFGRYIKLSNGNVASRILPIKIHDLDVEDKSLLESEMGGVLRAIEFIYKEAGVNRPLKATDDRSLNQNKIDYRNQVNKVANAIKEMISAVKNPTQTTPSRTGNRQPVTGNDQNPSRKKAFIVSLVVLFIAVIGYFFYQQRTTTLDKSIAVLSFADMSPNHDQEYFGDGIAEEIINVLAQSGDIKVIARSSSFQFKGKNEDLRTIGKMLDVATILEGSVRKSDNLIRVTAQLIRTEDGAHLWSKTFDRKPADIFSIQDEIATAISAALKATLSPNGTSDKKEIWNEEARKLYQTGRFYFERSSKGDNLRARDFFKQSLDKDSAHATVWAYYAATYSSDGVSLEGFNRKALQIDSLNSDALVSETIFNIRFRFDHQSAKKLIDKAYRLYPKDARVLRNACHTYNAFGLPDQAMVFGKMAITVDPLQAWAYYLLADAYYLRHQYDSSKMIVRKLQAVSPNQVGVQTLFIFNYLMLKQYDSVLFVTDQLPVDSKAFYGSIVSAINGDRKTSDEKIEVFKRTATDYAINYSLALIYCCRKEYDLAVDYLEKSYAAREKDLSSYIKVEPLLDPLRNHPRFIAIIKKFDL